MEDAVELGERIVVDDRLERARLPLRGKCGESRIREDDECDGDVGVEDDPQRGLR